MRSCFCYRGIAASKNGWPSSVSSAWLCGMCPHRAHAGTAPGSPLALTKMANVWKTLEVRLLVAYVRIITSPKPSAMRAECYTGLSVALVLPLTCQWPVPLALAAQREHSTRSRLGGICIEVEVSAARVPGSDSEAEVEDAAPASSLLPPSPSRDSDSGRVENPGCRA